MLNSLFLAVVFLGALILSCLLFNRWMPYPPIPNAGEKVEYLHLHGDEYDTVFVGSSRVNFQIMPSLFDETLAAAGRSAKSFNAGQLGMRPPEEGYFLDHVLRQPHRRLRLVFIELMSLEARAPKVTSERFVSWHDGPRMGLLWTWVRGEWAQLHVAGTAEGGLWSSYWAPLSVWFSHVPALCQQMGNLGRGATVVQEWLLTERRSAGSQRKWGSLGAQRDGWMPYDARETMDEKTGAAYRKDYAARLDTPAVPFDDLASDTAVEAMLEAVQRAGATPIFFVPPMTTDRYYYPPPELAGKMTIWNFSDPHLYPELFAPESRCDHIHLNTAGARIFTRILAQKTAQLPP